MTPVVKVDWTSIEVEVERIVDTHRGVKSVVPILRGGAVPAAMVAGRLGVPVNRVPSTGCLVVDDLVDTGATATVAMLRWEGIPFDALFRKPHSPTHLAPLACEVDRWLVFPWETVTEATGPEENVTRLLEFIGEDPTRPGLVDTPRRVLSALSEMTQGYHLDPATYLAVTFPDSCDEMVVVTGIDFTSMCEHHMLTFTGQATVAYIPDGKVVGLSKLARVVDVFAQRLQVQERLTEEIAEAIDTQLQPKGVGVVVEAKHSCMGCRGVKKPGATMVTSSLRGALKDKPAARAEFLSLARLNRG